MAVATLVLLSAVVGVDGAAAQPSIPATFFGSASIDGKAVPDDTTVRAFVDGKDCTQPSGRAGTLQDGGVSAYSITVMHDSQEAGCGMDGKTVTFTVGGRAAAQTAKWTAGVQHLDLNAGGGEPLALPTSASPTPNGPQLAATATERALFTPRAGGTPPTDDVHLNGTISGQATAVAGQGSDSGSDGPPVAVVILIVVAVLAVAGGAAGFALSRRRPRG
jgi:hypothetical protein